MKKKLSSGICDDNTVLQLSHFKSVKKKAQYYFYLEQIKH
jgi:hypothetical protein